MKKEINNSKSPAFSQSRMSADNYTGLTKREYIAGLAMSGIVSNQEFLKNLNAEPKKVVESILEITDELLKQLETPNT